MSSTMTASRARWSPEWRFFTAMSMAMFLTVYLGFARSFFLRPWFPGIRAPQEPFFYFHGAVFTTWFVLMIVQPSLVTAGRTDLHRRVGRYGAGVAALMVLLGVVGALIAAHRPTGFIGVPIPALQILIVPLCDVTLVFLLALVVWDFARSGRLHPVTLWGGLLLVASQPLRLMLSGTEAWLSFGRWAVGLLGQ